MKLQSEWMRQFVQNITQTSNQKLQLFCKQKVPDIGALPRVVTHTTRKSSVLRR